MKSLFFILFIFTLQSCYVRSYRHFHVATKRYHTHKFYTYPGINPRYDKYVAPSKVYRKRGF